VHHEQALEHVMQIGLMRKLLFFFALPVFIIACTPPLPKMTPQPGELSNNIVPPGTLLVVYKPDGTRSAFNYDEFNTLEKDSITIGSKVYQGPRLFTVLDAARIENYKAVILIGEKTEIRLVKRQIHEGMIIDIDQRNHLQFLAESIPVESWVDKIDVIEVEAE